MVTRAQTATLTDLLFEKVDVGLCLVAPDGTIVRANAEWLRSTGFTEEQVVGDKIVDLFPDTRDMALALHARARAGHRVEVPRHAQIVKGLKTWWEGTIEPVPMEGGTGLLITAREVTPAGVAAADELALYRTVFESMSEGFCVIAVLFDERSKPTDYRFVQVNPAFERHTGIAHAAGRRMREIAPTHEEHWFEIYGRVALTGEPARFENRAEALGRWYDVFAYRVGRPEDRTVAILFTDITERKRTDEVVRANEQRLHALADSMPQLAWTARPDGYITWYNRRWYEYTGTTPEEMEGWGWKSVHDPTTLPAVLARWTASIATGTAFEMEFPLRAADGNYRRFLTRVFPLKDERGNVLQWLGTNTDVTDFVQAQDALREADRRKDVFLGMLSHELRNPLAPIRNSTYILQHAAPGSDQARRAQTVIQRQTEHLTRLVDDLLDVTRIVRGKIELRRAQVDLREVVARAAEDFRVLLQDRGVEFEVALPGERLEADADATRVTQVVGNLLHNATKFTHGGDTVTLSMTVRGGAAEIRVSDTGAGIEPELLPRIFEAFVQGERTLARADGGLGLGLALVKGLTELHGGTVTAQSAGKGQGAEFVVRLPLAEPVARQLRADAATVRAHGRRRVLVVDDNTDAAESLADLLRMLGHDAEVAFDGPTAIAATRERRPDVVLCDIGLPGMDGYAVAKAIRAAGLDAVQLVAITGYAQPEDVKRAVEAGFDAHVPKPPDPEHIERLLR